MWKIFTPFVGWAEGTDSVKRGGKFDSFEGSLSTCQKLGSWREDLQLCGLLESLSQSLWFVLVITCQSSATKLFPPRPSISSSFLTVARIHAILDSCTKHPCSHRKVEARRAAASEDRKPRLEKIFIKRSKSEFIWKIVRTCS
jgi:hypothetical protein